MVVNMIYFQGHKINIAWWYLYATVLYISNHRNQNVYSTFLPHLLRIDGQFDTLGLFRYRYTLAVLIFKSLNFKL